MLTISRSNLMIIKVKFPEKENLFCSKQILSYVKFINNKNNNENMSSFSFLLYPFIKKGTTKDI